MRTLTVHQITTLILVFLVPFFSLAQSYYTIELAHKTATNGAVWSMQAHIDTQDPSIRFLSMNRNGISDETLFPFFRRDTDKVNFEQHLEGIDASGTLQLDLGNNVSKRGYFFYHEDYDKPARVWTNVKGEDFVFPELNHVEREVIPLVFNPQFNNIPAPVGVKKLVLPFGASVETILSSEFIDGQGIKVYPKHPNINTTLTAQTMNPNLTGALDVAVLEAQTPLENGTYYLTQTIDGVESYRALEVEVLLAPDFDIWLDDGGYTTTGSVRFSVEDSAFVLSEEMILWESEEGIQPTFSISHQDGVTSVVVSAATDGVLWVSIGASEAVALSFDALLSSADFSLDNRSNQVFEVKYYDLWGRIVHHPVSGVVLLEVSYDKAGDVLSEEKIYYL